MELLNHQQNKSLPFVKTLMGNSYFTHCTIGSPNAVVGCGVCNDASM